MTRILNSSPQQIITSLTSILQKNPYVLGLILVGSQARTSIYMDNEHSDMEAYIIVKDEKVKIFEKQLPEIVNRLGKVIFSYKNRWAGFSTVFDDLFRLELPIAKQSELSSVFFRPKPQTVKVLIDKTNGSLEQVLKKRPQSIDFQKIFQEIVLDFWYMAVVAVQYYQKREIWNSRSALQVLLSSFIKLMELLQDKNILLLETNKRMEQFLSSEQIRLLQKITPVYNKRQIKYSLKKIIEIFPQVCGEITRKHHYSYRKEIEDEIKQKLNKLIKKDFLTN